MSSAPPPKENQKTISDQTASDQIGTHLVLETDTMRIWHIYLGPGETLAAHRHDRPYFWTVVTDGLGRAHFGDSHSADVTYRAGDTKYFADLSDDNSFTHDLTNLGSSDLIFVTVEFKS